MKSVGLSKGEALLAALVKQLPPAKDEPPAADSCAPLSVTVLAIPHGAQIDASGRIVWPDGSEVPPEQTAFVPFAPTPALDATEPAPEPVVEPVSVSVVEDDKVALLDLHRRRRDDEPGSGAA